MELIEVELIVDSLEDKENKKERVKGDKWYVTKERLDILSGNNAYHKCFVKETGNIKGDEAKEETKKRKKKSE